jgi:hypothetical protein
MTLEEKVVAYLDGSLGEEESAELLHRLSASPDKRAVLEEHLRLTNMLSLGRKPFSVPAAAERELVSRLPFLGHAFSETPRAVPFFAKPMTLIASAAAVLAVVGGLWWNADRDVATQQNAPVAAAQNSPAPATPNARIDVKSGGNTKDVSSTNDVHASKEMRNANNVASSQPMSHATKHERTLKDNVVHSATISTPQISAPQNEGAAPLASNASDESSPAISAAPLKDAAIPIPSGHSLRTLHEIAFGAPAKVHPFSVGVSSMASGYYFPTLDASTNSALGMDPQITADYDITEWFSIGLEAGYTEFGNVTNNYVFAPSLDGTQYSQLSYVTNVAPTHTGYVRTSLHFTVDPMADFPIRFGASGGYAFQGTSAPCAALSAGVARTVSDDLTLDLDFVLSGIWSAQVDQMGASATGLIGITHQDTRSTAPFTSAFGLRAGIRYRP